jgi:hypothetical protein
MAERVYAVLLRAYPASFRAAFGREMAIVFRDRSRAGDVTRVRFWIEIVNDLARTAPELRLEALHARRTDTFLERPMRPMATVSMLVGGVQIVNALVEARAGLATPGGYSLLGVTLGTLAAILLVAAGAALFARGRDAAWLALSAVAGCAALVIVTLLVQPWMSMFGVLLGIGFPIALVVFLFVTRGQNQSTPRSA